MRGINYMMIKTLYKITRIIVKMASITFPRNRTLNGDSYKSTLQIKYYVISAHDRMVGK